MNLTLKNINKQQLNKLVDIFGINYILSMCDFKFDSNLNTYESIIANYIIDNYHIIKKMDSPYYTFNTNVKFSNMSIVKIWQSTPDEHKSIVIAHIIMYCNSIGIQFPSELKEFTTATIYDIMKYLKNPSKMDLSKYTDKQWYILVLSAEKFNGKSLDQYFIRDDQFSIIYNLLDTISFKFYNNSHSCWLMPLELKVELMLKMLELLNSIEYENEQLMYNYIGCTKLDVKFTHIVRDGSYVNIKYEADNIRKQTRMHMSFILNIIKLSVDDALKRIHTFIIHH